MIRSSVVLPHPDGPSSETNSLAWTSRSMSSSTVMAPSAVAEALREVADLDADRTPVDR